MATKIWRFLDSGKEDAFFHMALDEVLAHSARDGISSPVFRLYEWTPSAVTLGYSQRIYDIIDVGRCREDGVDVTRRLTGGRAVFHHDEIAYTVISSVDDPLFGGTVMETYLAVSKVFLAGFRRIGIPAVMAPGEVTRRHGSGYGSGLPCFLSTARHEITLNGRKLVGSAQRRIGELFLQQGSILFGPGQERLADYLIDPDMAITCRRDLARGKVDLAAEIGGKLTRDALKEAMFGAFQDATGSMFRYDGPTDEERRETSRLRKQKYSTKGWIEDHG